MKQTIVLQQKQRLTLTRKLQRALHILHVSNQHLHQEINTLIENNPLIEREEDNPQTTTVEALPYEQAFDYPTMKRELPAVVPEIQDTSVDTLQDYLRWQINASHCSIRDTQIATTIIDSINEDGYLTNTIDAIQKSLAQTLTTSLDEITRVLVLIQALDPIGVGARNLSECLLLQLQQLPTDTKAIKAASTLVKHHMNEIAKGDKARLKKITQLSATEIEQALNLIHSLQPRPGSAFGAPTTHYITPDIIVTKEGSQWQVKLNQENIPKIRLNTDYAKLLKKHQHEPLNTYLTQARDFIHHLHNRFDTLLTVAKHLVIEQQAFLEHGATALKPLTLKQLAEILSLHESTVSRAVSNKYILTPSGIFPLSDFFTSSLDTDSGKMVSSRAVKALIKKYILAENPNKPLSDSKIGTLLNQAGIHIARRTVSKYRELMAIPSSHDRKNNANFNGGKSCISI